MAKSMIEKYEQILADDPGSMAFVELAKALIDRGDHQRAIEVCRSGIEHHPESIVGRVLWGKALISSGRPAEAMEQFEQAIAIEKDNPYAYNLIGEVLLHKGLFRSAIPILKKAVALQPRDTRVRQWLEQAQRALGGQPPEEQRDATTVDAHPPTADFEPTAPHELPPLDAREATVPDAKALPEEPETVGGMTDVFRTLAAREEATDDEPGPEDRTADPPREAGGQASAPRKRPHAHASPDGPPVLAPARPPPVLTQSQPKDESEPPVDDPFAAAGGGQPEGESETVPGLTGVFESLTSREPSQPEGDDSSPDGGLLGHLPDPPAETAPPPVPTPPPLRRMSEPNVQISPELLGAPPLPRSRSQTGSGLLGDLPELEMPEETRPPVEAQKPAIAPEAAEDIAREYERELRAKLLEKPPQTFWRRNWLPLSIGAVAVVALGTALAIYIGTRKQNIGADLASLRSRSWQALTLDTPYGYHAAEELSQKARAISETDASSLASAAYANARLFAFTGDPSRKAEVQRLVPSIGEKHPGIAAAASLLIADVRARDDAAKALESLDTGAISEAFERAVVQVTLAEHLLAGSNVEKGLAALERARESDPAHVRALVALGAHFIGLDEPEHAAKFLERAKAASPDHVPTLVALLNARMAADLEGHDPAVELANLERAWNHAKQQNRPWPPEYEADLALLRGRVLALTGDRVEAINLLANGASRWPARAGEFHAALGAAEASAGNFDKAEKAYGDALKHPTAPNGVLEELCRVLIARGRIDQALERAQAIPDKRRLALIRGIARFEQGDLVKARQELNATRRDGKVPLEAAVYLATIDAMQGRHEAARAVLDRAAQKTGRLRAAALVGLGRLYQTNGRRVEALAAYEDAGKVPGDWEGPCSLGRMQLAEASFEKAKSSFELALSRNRFHREARVGLGHALLALGDAEAARKAFEAVLEGGRDAAAHRGLARALLAMADVRQARRHATLARRLEPKSPDNARLFGQIALASGDAQGALRSLEKQLADEPANPDLLSDLGEVQLKIGEVAAAEKSFEAALKSDKTHLRARLGTVNVALPERARNVMKLSDTLVKETTSAPAPLRARALALQSRVQLSLNRKEKARELAEQAVAAFDGSADAHFALALAAKAQDDHVLGQNELQRVVALDPSFAEAHLSLAESLARDPANRKRAIAELEAYLRIAPKGPYAPIASKALAGLKKRRR